jgi:hypothetical protein
MQSAFYSVESGRFHVGARSNWQRDLSVSYNRIGDVQRAQGDLPSALSSYKQGLEIAQKLAARDPANTDWQRDLSVSYERIKGSPTCNAPRATCPRP